MFDFRLRVFHTVAKRLNFTKAAKELYISQPAVTKHIKELEAHFKNKLFERNGTRIKLTDAGTKLLGYTVELLELYRRMEADLNAMREANVGTLRIGASTTIANYILPVVLPSFKQEFPDITVELVIDNTEHIEQLLVKKEIDLGITEGFTKSSVLHYDTFLKDEIVLVASSANPLAEVSSVEIQELLQLPMLVREQGSGTLDVINHALNKVAIKPEFTTVMQLSSTESIKLYLRNSDCVAFLSVYAVLNELKDHTFTVIDVEGLHIERNFYWVQSQGAHNYLAKLFIEKASSYNFKL